MKDEDDEDMLLTVSLLMAVLVAVTAQFLVGYNLGVMNAPSKVVFPTHTTIEWSLAVSAFAIGGPRNPVYHFDPLLTLPSRRDDRRRPR